MGALGYIVSSAIEAGDEIFAPHMKILLLRAFALARRRHHLAESTRRRYRHRIDATSMPSWCWRRPTRTASDCENVAEKCAATSSSSWAALVTQTDSA